MLSLACAACATCATPQDREESRIRLVLDVAASSLHFMIQEQEAFVYQFDSEFAIPHIWPLNSPSGRSLLVQKTEPYPHHRALWIVDRVQLNAGVITDFYHEWKNLRSQQNPSAGHHSFIRHDGFEEINATSAIANLTWLVAENQPVLAQRWSFGVEDLGNGEYILDMDWDLTASYGPVTFHSDWVHYAWPYLRMDPSFSGEQGGVITSDDGRVGQVQTDEKYARWIDYSSDVDGIREGLTVFTPNDGQQRKWLTREYGTFGPRRPDALSGSGFVLKEGESLHGQVQILVHQGGVERARELEFLQRNLAWME